MQRLVSPRAPQAIGAYAQGTVARGSFAFISGQLPLDSTTGEIVSVDIADQVVQSMINLGEILKEAGLTFNNLLKVTIYITDINLFAKINKAYASFFTHEKYPARSVVEVSALPKGCKVEIEGIAICKSE